MAQDETIITALSISISVPEERLLQHHREGGWQQVH